jgi:Zn-dependent peptidase ImmA (M78 family)
MIILSLRGKSEDKFWFSFFHEAGHILRHSKKDLFIASGNKTDKDDTESEADEFAANLLIPKQYNELLLKCKSHDDIEILARILHISPGIIAGQYQYKRGKWTYFQDMIRRIEWRSVA